MDLQGIPAIVTGAGSGLGLATARALAGFLHRGLLCGALSDADLGGLPVARLASGEAAVQ